MASIDTVNDIPPRVQYVASAAQTLFPYPFPVFSDSDLVVDVDGVTASLDVDYQVSGEGDDLGGDVTWIGTAFVGGEIVTIYRDIAIERDTDISQNGQWLSSAYNDEQDKIFLILQQLKAQLARSLRLPITAEVDDADIELDASFANTYLTFDGNLKPVPALLSATTITQQIIGTLLNPRTNEEILGGAVIVNYALLAGNVLRYGTNTTPGTTDMTTAIQAALNQRAQGGAAVYIPTGTYRQTATLSYPLSLTPLHMHGEGQFASVITTALNIENLTNAGADGTHGLPDPVIHDLSFYNTFAVTAGAGSTSFHIHLKNPLNARIYNTHCKANFGDLDYNVNNHGGIWLDPVGGYSAAFQNMITGCWMQNCQALISTSDSAISDSFVWGHPCDYAIKATAGNVAVLDCPGIIGSRGHGGVWIAGGLNCKIANNFFDGSYDAVNSGYGAFVESGATWTQITGNTFWRNYYNGIYLNTPFSDTITGNQFWDCGRADSATAKLNADICVEGISFQPNANTITANTAYRGATRANQGAFILEVNSGFNCVNNRYVANTVSAAATQYATPAIVTAATLLGGGSVLIGNVGFGTETEVYGSFTGTLTGCTTSPTATINYTRQGNWVSLYCPTLVAVSNTTSASITGMPAAIRPTNTGRGFAFVTTNSVATFGAWAIDNTGTITLYVANSSTGFAAANNKGVIDGLTLFYPLT